MKRFLVRLLAIFGLAPARRGSAAQAKLIEELKAGSLAWKTKAAEAMERAKSLDAELRDQVRRARKLKVAAEKSEQRAAELEKLQERLASTERELAMAREHLMAIEVKLDILEGAANVLDARTRSAIRQQPRETGAPV